MRTVHGLAAATCTLILATLACGERQEEFFELAAQRRSAARASVLASPEPTSPNPRPPPRVTYDPGRPPGTPERPTDPPPVDVPPTPIDPTEAVVGTTPAAFDVSAHGVANYRIPIEVPPGFRGIAPKLALTYDHTGDIGVAGPGFALTGLSRIERCAGKVSGTGIAPRAVQLDVDDDYCLDGLRLIAVQGAHGADGTVYMTEGQTWTRIVSRGQCTETIPAPTDQPTGAVVASGPCWFDATLRNGAQVRFGEVVPPGCSTATGVASVGGARVEWPVTHVLDDVGNRLSVEWREGGDKWCAPQQVIYGENTKLGRAPDRRVWFDYETSTTHADPNGLPTGVAQTRFVAGIRRTKNARLTRIATELELQGGSGWSLVKEYKLGYDLSPWTYRPRLTSVRECGRTGACLPPTLFGWSEGGWLDRLDTYDSDTLPTGINAPGQGAEYNYSGDFNGDGRTDYLQYNDHDSPSGLQYLSQPGPYLLFDVSSVPMVPGLELPLKSWRRGHTGDFDGDGYTDLLLLEDDTHSIYLGGANGLSGTAIPGPADSILRYNRDVLVADYDGDGTSELFVTYDNEPDWRLYKFQQGAFAIVGQGVLPQAGCFPDFDDIEGSGNLRRNFISGDFNGDGRSDVLVYRRVFLNPLPPPHLALTNLPPGLMDPWDSTAFEKAEAWILMLSDGAGHLALSGKGLWPESHAKAQPGDFNGDGLTDLIVTGLGGSVRAYATGAGFTYDLPASTPISLPAASGTMPTPLRWHLFGDVFYNDQLWIGDLNGDGRADIASAWQPLVLDGVEVPTVPYDGVRLRTSVPNLDAGRVDILLSRALLTDVTPSHFGGDFQGNGQLAIYYVSDNLPNSPAKFYRNFRTNGPDLGVADYVVAITNGVGARTEIEYLPLTNGGLHTPASGLPSSLRAYQGPRHVVSKVTRVEGQSKQEYETFYTYSGATVDRGGRGFLGFREVRQKQGQDVTATTYHLAFPQTGLVESREIQYATSTWPGLMQGEPVRRTDYLYRTIQTHPGVYDVRLTSETITDFAYRSNGSIPGTVSRVSYGYDTYSNITDELRDPDVAVSNDHLQITTGYLNDPTGWSLGRPDSRVTSDSQGQLLEERFEYDALGNMAFHSKKDTANGVNIGIRKTINRLGQVTATDDPSAGHSEYEYEPDGTLRTITNALKQVSKKFIDPGLGVEYRRIDLNGVVTDFDLDDFGRVTAITGPDENGAPIVLKEFYFIPLSVDPLTAPNGLGYVIQTRTRESWTTSQWRIEEVFKDALERSYVNRKFLDSKSVQSDVHYDQYRESAVAVESRPFRWGETPSFTHYLFDERIRPRHIFLPDQTANTMEYDDVARAIRKWEPNGTMTLMEMDGLGNLVRKTAANGGATTYEYDALSRLVLTTDPVGVTTTVHYDSLGRKDWIHHSDTGTSIFVYGPTGHLLGEVDPMGNHIGRTFDALDRTLVKTLYKGTTPETTYTMDYDDPGQSFGIGQLTRVEKQEKGATTQIHDFGYDRYGRQASSRVQLEGRVFSFLHHYAPSGEAIGTTYPDGSMLELEYRPGGLLAEVSMWEPTDPPGVFKTYAMFHAYDQEGRPTLTEHANKTAVCHQYDPSTGHLLRHRVDKYTGVTGDPCTPEEIGVPILDKEYAWDDVGRIDHIHDVLDPSKDQSFGYDQVGALIQASGAYGLRTYQYDLAGNRAVAGGVVYGFSGHRLVSSNQNLQVTYDASGNVVTKVDPVTGQSTSLDWTVEDRLRQVTSNAGVTSFDYDFTGQRVKKVEPSGQTTWYGSRIYEQVELPDGTTLTTKYLPGPTGHIAQVTRTFEPALAAVTDHEVLAAMMAYGGLGGRVASTYHAALAVLSEPATSALVFELVRGTVFLASAALLAFAVLLVVRRREEQPRLRPLLSAVTAAAFLLTYGSGLPKATAAMAPGAHGPGVPQVGTLYFHVDHVGSTSLAVDEFSNVTSRVDYEPYGRVAASSSGVDESRAKFNGHELDAGSQFYYANDRYYDPDLGRFLSADTSIGGEPMRASALNRYAYASNNPVSYRDPSGRFAIFAFIGMLIGTAIAGALIAGTGGKIFTDPAHAFDDWSWGRALAGFLIGAAVGAVSFAIGTIGSAATFFGLPLKDILHATWSTAVVRGTMAYASGKSVGQIFAAFGVGAFTGFLTGTGFIGVAGVGGQILSQQLTTLADSALKAATGQEMSFTVSIWAFSLTVDHKGKLNFGVNYAFLAAEATRMGLALASGKGPDVDFDSFSVRDNMPEAETPGLFGLGDKLSQAFDEGGSALFSTAADLAKTVITYGASQLKQRAGPSSGLGVLGGAAVDIGSAWANEGVDRAHCALDPQAAGC